ncbi:dTDP-4-dehydrorhamnose 3,5-epimerase [Methylovirgula sp. 4M-Z18]|uniref:dTDP-4-dehydrorhamnose 3,5-epimerase n=1 Tax=Methylovirgula sp. 4M-Z18 TaxID=2293567 RepID=UPI000E2FBFB1|nr:dTDP-4-dehydrorhamnose 3,5-epimerase [Methylovirgula sp. 4M-Z18]RFB80891.1 dTDP-4-dehydrorhamnose 3,5-epimerase [Methylovirgula sp. 4M-Z18]
MEIIRDPRIPAIRLIRPKRHGDARGYFAEVYRVDKAAAAGLPAFVQDNHALSQSAGTLRGLHFQIGAAAQAKLVRCLRGRILDVAVDLRHGSPTFGAHVAYELSAENGDQLYIPAGFAHGYCTLEPDTEITYKVSAYYDASADKGLTFDDPALKIAWPVAADLAVLSAKDRALPKLAELPAYFSYAQHRD